MSVLATHLSSSHTFTKHAQPSLTLLRNLGVRGDAHCGPKTQHEYFIKVDKKKGVLRDNIRQVHLLQSELFDEDGVRARDGEKLRPGQLGENITTVGLDLLALGKGARLRFVEGADDSSAMRSNRAAEEWSFRHVVPKLAFAIAILSMFSIFRNWYIVSLTSLIDFLSGYLAFRKSQSLKPHIAVVKLTGRRRPCGKIDEYVGAGLRNRFTVKDENGKVVGHKAGVMGVVEEGGEVRPGMRVLVERREVGEELPAI